MTQHTVRFFEYKGAIGALSDLSDPTQYINDITEPNQMGVLIESGKVGMPTEVIELFKNNFKREGGSFAGIMLTKHSDGKASIGILGGGSHLICNPKETIFISRDCDLSVLDLCQTVKNEPPEGFIAHVDSITD